MQYEFPFQDELDKLNTLLSQNQFELLVPKYCGIVKTNLRYPSCVPNE